MAEPGGRPARFRENGPQLRNASARLSLSVPGTLLRLFLRRVFGFDFAALCALPFGDDDFRGSFIGLHRRRTAALSAGAAAPPRGGSAVGDRRDVCVKPNGRFVDHRILALRCYVVDGLTPDVLLPVDRPLAGGALVDDALLFFAPGRNAGIFQSGIALAAGKSCHRPVDDPPVDFRRGSDDRGNGGVSPGERHRARTRAIAYGRRRLARPAQIAWVGGRLTARPASAATAAVAVIGAPLALAGRGERALHLGERRNILQVTAGPYLARDR